MEFIEQIEEIANAKPKEEKVKRENALAKDLQLLCEKYKVSMTITQPQIQITAL